MKRNYLSLLAKLSDISVDVDESEFLSSVVAVAGQYLDFDVLTINLFNAQASALFLAAGYSRYPADPCIGDTLQIGMGVVGTAAKRRRPLLLQDVEKSSLYIAKYPATRSELACPMIYKGQLIGVLNVESGHKNAFTRQDIDSLKRLAIFLANSIQVLRSRQQVQRSDIAYQVLTAKFAQDYQTFFENASQGMGRMDANGVLVLVNSSFARIFGYSEPEGMLKVRFRDLLLDGARYDQLLAQLVEKDFLYDDLQARHKSGQTLDLRINCWLSRESDGRLTYINLALEDISEAKRLQQELQKSERMATMGELAAVIAHEIRNPLAAVLNSAEELQARVNFTGTNRRLIEIILEEAGRLERVVRDFLIFARPTPPQVVAVDINKLMERSLELVLQMDIARNMDGALEVEKHLKSDLPFVQADPDQLIQVLLNILINAVQATKGKGRISVSTMLESAADWSGCPYLVIDVTDNGSGINPQDMGRIFEPFFTTKPSGTGLGLSIAKQIMDTHNGALQIESRLGQGTSVRIVLPTSQPTTL